ncbi:hypothetical protein ACDQ55_06670 [Chitinophaga sp. 30R24]|uniref:hypothetical protein n=1 Tax=Chitinophaga sp. 30R24 TaxID=3248838 RepID=UPI003B921D47
MPANHELRVPGITAKILAVKILGNPVMLQWQQRLEEAIVTLPAILPDTRNTVLVMEYEGLQPDLSQLRTQTVSNQYPQADIPAIWAIFNGHAQTKPVIYSRDSGDWKYDDCIIADMLTPDDAVIFPLDVQDAGEYKVTLEYACEASSVAQQGVVTLNGQQLKFLTLFTGYCHSQEPMSFIQHSVGSMHFNQGKQNLTVKPIAGNKSELFWLRKIILQPVK